MNEAQEVLAHYLEPLRTPLLTEAQEYLSQYGVLGMKWGRRKDRGTGRVKTPSSEDHILSRETKKRRTRTLTNTEIRKANERLQLERQFAQLKRDQATLTRGHNAIKTGLALAGTAGAIYTFTQSPLGRKVTSLGRAYLEEIRKTTGA